MGGAGAMFLPLIILAAMMIFMTRSQKKQQKQRQEQLDSMHVGSKVVTIGGLHGIISEINKDKSTVLLDCEGIYLEFNRSSIATVLPSEPVAATTAVDTSQPEAEEVAVEDAEEVSEISETNDKDK